MPADLVFVNGTVHPMDGGRPAQAVAVRAGRITAVGPSAEVEALAGPDTEVVDLAGGTLLPGINDSHLHAGMLGAYWPDTWLGALASGGGLPAPRELVTDDDRRAALRRAWDVLLPLGVTSYTEPGLGPGARGQHGGGCDDDMMRIYTELAAAGDLPVRVTALLLFGELDGPSDLDAFTAGLHAHRPVTADGPRRWRVAGVKVFADGIPPMHTAWLSEPDTAGAVGAPLVRGGAEPLRAMIRRAARAGWQVGVHATGDRAIAECVDAFAADPSRAASHYVIHGDLARPDTLAVMAAAGIGLNAQPEIRDATAPLVASALGPERAAAAVPLRSALAAGVPVCLSSDAPVLAADWRRTVASAASRPDGEAVPVYEALRAFTATPAVQDGAADWKGTIAVGKVADLCVLDRDPLATPVAEIPHIAVRMTVVDGRIAFAAERAAGEASYRA